MAALFKVPGYIELEHEVAQLLQDQEEYGMCFDEKSAEQLTLSLLSETTKLKKEIVDTYPYVPGGEFTPKRDNQTQGYVAGATMTRLKETNPTSRDHIQWILTTYNNWKPSKMTATGKPVVDETVLKDINTEISMKFLRIMTISKMLGMLQEGNNAWLKLSTTASRIHHHCSVATTTHRAAHRRPNLAQVPSDSEFRKLFIATPGQVMVGADLSGIELRMLASYLSRYDDGRYAEILLNGDIHQTNADKIGISRKQVKTVTYCFLYGGGNTSIGYAYDKQLSEAQAQKKGKEIKEAYIAAIPGLKQFLEAVKKAAGRGYIKLIDGRKINVDSGHKAVNYLLQGSAGVIAKRWMVINHHKSHTLGHQLCFVHDELQWECKPDNAELLKGNLEDSAIEAGEYYNLRIRINAEGQIGTNWAEVH